MQIPPVCNPNLELHEERTFGKLSSSLAKLTQSKMTISSAWRLSWCQDRKVNLGDLVSVYYCPGKFRFEPG